MAKYVVTEEYLMVIFSDLRNHSDMAAQLGDKVISAGKVIMGCDDVIAVSGSMTLNIKHDESQSRKDTTLLKMCTMFDLP